MKKRTLSFLLALVMCLSLLPMTALAAEMPTSIAKPEGVTIAYKYADAPYEGLNITMRKPADFAAIVQDFYANSSTINWSEYGVKGKPIVYYQVDWSLDSKDDWKYRTEWDSMQSLVGSSSSTWEMMKNSANETNDEDKIMGAFNLNYVNNSESWTWVGTESDGGKSGWTYALDDKYSVYENASAAYGDKYYIDFEEHTLYVRTRYVMNLWLESGDHEYICGEWSDVVAFGKDNVPYVRPTELPAPVISDLAISEETYNGAPMLEFTVNHTQELLDEATAASANGAEIFFKIEANVNNMGWKELTSNNTLRSGTVTARFDTYAESVDNADYVQLRTRYQYHVNAADYFYGPYSEIITIGAPAWGNASDWATEELARADELGLIPDCLEGEDLTQDITRAEFAAVAVKVYEALSGTAAIPAVNNPFTDTSDVEVLKAYNIGAVNGTSATTYDPDALLNREQAATMLTRVFKKISLVGWTLQTDGQFTLPYTKPAAFADDKDISDWAKDSVYFMAANGIINGVGNNKFAPKNVTTEEQATGYANATREQALLIAVRMVENLGK